MGSLTVHVRFLACLMGFNNFNIYQLFLQPHRLVSIAKIHVFLLLYFYFFLLIMPQNAIKVLGILRSQDRLLVHKNSSWLLQQFSYFQMPGVLNVLNFVFNVRIIEHSFN
jgi:hypothetical protein